MDLTKPIFELRRQRDKIDDAIQALERLAEGQGGRRGRPSKWLTEAQAKSPGDGAITGPAGEPQW